MTPPSRDALEARLHYPLGDALPPSGGAIGVAPGVKWVRMTLPFALDHINLWLLRDRLDGREGWTVVDTCISRDEAKAQWEQVFEQDWEAHSRPVQKHTFFEKVIAVAVKAFDKINLSWW